MAPTSNTAVIPFPKRAAIVVAVPLDQSDAAETIGGGGDTEYERASRALYEWHRQRQAHLDLSKPAPPPPLWAFEMVERSQQGKPQSQTVEAMPNETVIPASAPAAAVAPLQEPLSYDDRMHAMFREHLRAFLESDAVEPPPYPKELADWMALDRKPAARQQRAKVLSPRRTAPPKRTPPPSTEAAAFSTLDFIVIYGSIAAFCGVLALVGWGLAPLMAVFDALSWVWNHPGNSWSAIRTTAQVLCLGISVTAFIIFVCHAIDETDRKYLASLSPEERARVLKGRAEERERRQLAAAEERARAEQLAVEERARKDRRAAEERARRERVAAEERERADREAGAIRDEKEQERADKRQLEATMRLRTQGYAMAYSEAKYIVAGTLKLSDGWVEDRWSKSNQDTARATQIQKIEELAEKMIAPTQAGSGGQAALKIGGPYGAARAAADWEIPAALIGNMGGTQAMFEE